MSQAEMTQLVVKKLESMQATLVDLKTGLDGRRISQQNSFSILQKVLTLIAGWIRIHNFEDRS